eukprot:603672-Alexandrium_andersonii.AAC.1
MSRLSRVLKRRHASCPWQVDYRRALPTTGGSARGARTVRCGGIVSTPFGAGAATLEVPNR